jgi:hypothetical protein
MSERTAVLGECIETNPAATYTAVVRDAIVKARMFSAASLSVARERAALGGHKPSLQHAIESRPRRAATGHCSRRSRPMNQAAHSALSNADPRTLPSRGGSLQQRRRR